jgi:hypothetical protein
VRVRVVRVKRRAVHLIRPVIAVAVIAVHEPVAVLLHTSLPPQPCEAHSYPVKSWTLAHRPME